MKRALFYITQQNSQSENYPVIARLASQLINQNHKIYCSVDTEAEAEQLDQILWTFNDISFLPHKIRNIDKHSAAPLEICFNAMQPLPTDHDVWINLSHFHSLPNWYAQFNCIVEMVWEEEKIKQRGRERYKIYKSLGYAVEHHTI